MADRVDIAVDLRGLLVDAAVDLVGGQYAGSDGGAVVRAPFFSQPASMPWSSKALAMVARSASETFRDLAARVTALRMSVKPDSGVR